MVTMSENSLICLIIQTVEFGRLFKKYIGIKLLIKLKALRKMEKGDVRYEN